MEFKNKKLEDMKAYLRGRNVAIIGIGVSNIPLIRYLHRLGSQITVFDRRNIEEIDEKIVLEISSYKIEMSLGSNYLDSLVGFDIIFRSPSVRPDTKELLMEHQRGAIITSEIELVMMLCPGTIIGVTGSDGKTTTTSLIYTILKNKYNCYVGGNIGIPLFDKLDEMKPDDIVILELSSFQLMTMTVSPKIAVVTNISENHLDIHKDFSEYIEAKKNIFKYQNNSDLVVLNYDNRITRDFEREAKGKVRFFSSQKRLKGQIIAEDGVVKLCENERVRSRILSMRETFLKGTHNAENICAALLATKDLIDLESAKKAIMNFRGVEHRIEYVCKINDVEYYNDSIASSPARTIAGLNSFDEKLILIAGGYDKHLDYTPLAKPIVDKVKALILLGDTKEKIFDAVNAELNAQGKEMPIYDCNTMQEAVKIAKSISKKGDKVILSPASASFDMYKNFEERGKDFKRLVNEKE